MTTIDELRTRVLRFVDLKRPTEESKEIAKEILRMAMDAKGEEFKIENRAETREALRLLKVEPRRKEFSSLVLFFPEKREGTFFVEYKERGKPVSRTREYSRKGDATKALKRLKETKRSKLKWAKIEEK